MANEFLSVGQAAAKLGVKAATIRKWLKLGKIKGERFGGQWVLEPEQLLKAAAVTSTSTPAPAPPVSGLDGWRDNLLRDIELWQAHETNILHLMAGSYPATGQITGILPNLERSIELLEALKQHTGMAGSQDTLESLERALFAARTACKRVEVELLEQADRLLLAQTKHPPAAKA